MLNENKISKLTLNGEMLNNSLYAAVEAKALEWAECGIIVLKTEESETTLTMGLQFKKFKSLLVKTTGRTGESTDCFVQLGEETTLLLGSWGNINRAPLYKIERN